MLSKGFFEPQQFHGNPKANPRSRPHLRDPSCPTWTGDTPRAPICPPKIPSPPLSPRRSGMSNPGVHPTPFPRKIQPLWQHPGSLWDSLEFMGNRPGSRHRSKARLCLNSRISAGLVPPFSKDFLPSPRFPGNCIPGILGFHLGVEEPPHGKFQEKSMENGISPGTAPTWRRSSRFLFLSIFPFLVDFPSK